MKNITVLITTSWVLLITLNSTASAQRAYKCVDANGSISYQRKPCKRDDNPMLEEKGITDNKSYRESLQVVSEQLQSYTFTVLAFKWWQASSQKINDNTIQLKLKDPTGDSNISILIDFMIPINSDPFNITRLKELLRKKSQKIMEHSVEQRLTTVNIRTQGVLGMYSSFKDARIAEQPQLNNNQYLFNTQGIMYIDDILVNFTVLSNDLGSENHRYAMHFITKGITIKQ